MSLQFLLELALADLCGTGIGATIGFRLANARCRRKQELAEQEAESARRRRIHDTRRVSVAQPGTTPSRISQAVFTGYGSHVRMDGLDERGDSTT